MTITLSSRPHQREQRNPATPYGRYTLSGLCGVLPVAGGAAHYAMTQQSSPANTQA